jgi:hypothetical protein
MGLQGVADMKHIPRIAAVLLAASSLAAQELNEKTFDTWYAFILPKTSELAWRAIGWRGTLGEAWLEARTKDLPILFWAMNGHPCGCT